MTKGYFNLILHSHLPWVLSHGRWPHGTDWLNEATSECYLPLLRMLNRLMAKGIAPKITMGITPVLTEQLKHQAFTEEFEGYLKSHVNSSADDIKRFAAKGETNMAELARMWEGFYKTNLEDFTEKYNRDIAGAFADIQNKDGIEIITCAATHGYLPLIGSDRCVAAQIKGGVATYAKHYGREPRGIWLPECAYRPAYRWSYPIEGMGEPYDRKGVEEFLFDAGLSYFIVDSHLLTGGRAIGAYVDRYEALKRLWGQFERSYTQVGRQPKTPRSTYLVASGEKSNKACGILVRDPATGLQVWSGEYGYPGDGNYLEFHKKHWPSGNRYWKVTSAKSDLGDKKVYDPTVISGRIEENASHFAGLIYNLAMEHYQAMGKPGVVTAPFDAELFGHWWFEGPSFLERVIEILSENPDITLVTGSEAFEAVPPKEIITIPEGSWGEGGFHWIWFNEQNSWTWKHIYSAENRFLDLLGRFNKKPSQDAKRVMLQLGRELLLLQSSDWQFLISTWAARDYAENRLANHSAVFLEIADIAQRCMDNGGLPETDSARLEEAESMDDVFPHLDLRWWD